MKIAKIIYSFISAGIIAIAAMSTQAGTKVDIYELSLDQNLETPAIDAKIANKVQEYQYDQAVELIKASQEVELIRNGEVIIVTIPAEKLFEPNDTTLSKQGKNMIKSMFGFLKKPGFYKMLLVMHSDNTGSKKYTISLTRSRVNAVFDWFDTNGNIDHVVPYALGSSDPLGENDSMAKRNRNRRLEIYLVPGEAMLDQAKKGNISRSQLIRK